LTGIVEPPLNASFRYIKLTAGQSGAGEYNESVLTGETVTGTAPLLVATAVIALSNSPINGQTVNLINSEGRYIKPGITSGTVADDQMQQITGTMNRVIGNQTTTGAISRIDIGQLAAVGSSYTSSDISFDSSDSPDARTGNSTDVKHIQYTYYMRIA
jgi:hypothetical protein